MPEIPEQEPKTKSEMLACGDGSCMTFSGVIGYGRNVDQNSIKIRVGRRLEARIDQGGTITCFDCRTSRAVNAGGTYDTRQGIFHLQFDRSTAPKKGEEIVAEYRWKPHPLHGATIMVNVNNKNVMVPITLLQEALQTYLGND